VTGGWIPGSVRVLPARVRPLLVAAFLDSVGTGLFLAGGVVFLVRVVGLSGPQIGVGFGAAGVAGLVSTVPLATLADRVGARRMLVVVQCWRAACFVGLAFVTGPATFVIAAACQGAAESSVPALTQAVVARLVGDELRVRTMAVMRAVRNVGFSLGALAAGALVATDNPWAGRALFLGNAASFVVVAVQVARLPLAAVPARTTHPEPASGQPESTSVQVSEADGPVPEATGPVLTVEAHTPEAEPGLLRTVIGFRDARYLRLTALNAVLCLHMTLLSVVMPLWVLKFTSAPAAIVPLLLAVNTVIAVSLQVRLSTRFEDGNGGRRAMQWAAVTLTVCCLLTAATGTVPVVPAVIVLIIATAALTLGEICQSTGGWVLSYAWAPERRRVQYLGVFSLGASAQDVVGPLLLTGLVAAAGAGAWLGLAVLFAATAFLVRVVVPLVTPPGTASPRTAEVSSTTSASTATEVLST